MLQIIIHFIIISAICLIWGFPLTVLTKNSNQSHVYLNIEQIIKCFFTGIAILAIIGSWICLFAPLQFSILLAITLPVSLFNFRLIKTRKIEIPVRTQLKSLRISETFFLFTSIFLFFFLSSGRPILEDSDLYHLQLIKWNSEYGTIPGISNLYLRYGFNSNWFHLISFFSTPFKHQNFTYLNNTLCIWMLLFVFYQYKYFMKNSQELSSKHMSVFMFTILIYMLFEWDLFRVANSSTTYDFIITCFSLICIHYVLTQTLSSKFLGDSTYFILLLIGTAPFFKLTGFLLFFLLLIPAIKFNYTKRELLFFFAVFISASIPFLIKNYIQTGYLLFPYNIFDFFDPDWKTPEVLINNFNKYINLANHYINQSTPANAWVDNSKFSYYKDWFLHLTRPDQFLIILSTLGLLGTVILLRKIYKENFKTILLFQVLSYCMLFIWLLLSPDTRFAFGLLIFTACFPLSGLFCFILKEWMVQIGFVTCAIISIFYIFIKWKKEYHFDYLISPYSIISPPYKTININNDQYNIPEFINNNWNIRCYDTPLPCIYHLNPYLEWRDKDIKEGFRMKSNHLDSNFVKNYQY